MPLFEQICRGVHQTLANAAPWLLPLRSPRIVPPQLAAGTGPCVQDTDDDGVDDYGEVEQGSDPTDATDEGDPRSRVAMSFYFGDHSESHSEKYRLEVRPLHGVGTRPRSFSRINERCGQCETNTVYLKPGWSYEVRLFHSGTKPGESTDYDYTLRPVGDLPSNVFVVDEDTLFGEDNTVNLIGVGECNNPMYESDNIFPYWVNVTNELTGAVERIEHQGTALPLAVCPPDETRRSYFASHLYVVDAGGNVHDACVGPELGTRGITPYLRSVIDYSTLNEADRGNYHTDPARAGTTENMNKNFLLR